MPDVASSRKHVAEGMIKGPSSDLDGPVARKTVKLMDNVITCEKQATSEQNECPFVVTNQFVINTMDITRTARFHTKSVPYAIGRQVQV